MLNKAKAKLKELYEQPIPLGRAVLITATAMVLTYTFYGKPNVMVINRFYHIYHALGE